MSVDMKPYAQQAANNLHWNPDVVLAQWELETGHFTSSVFQQDHNLAGIKWVNPARNPGATGPGRKASDGGYYAHYNTVADGVQGYIHFVGANPRYANVSSTQDARAEAQLLHQDGWATDPGYADKIMATIGGGSSSAPITQTNGNGGGISVTNTGVSTPTPSAGAFPSGTDIISIIDQALTIQNFDVMHPLNSLTQDAGAISLRVVLVLVGLILFIFGLVAVVEKASGGAPMPVPVPV